MSAANDNVPPYNAAPITFISMFSGIEAASVAFPTWKPIVFAEIDKFPCGVLAHHYPHVPNVGDMSTHDWAQYAGKVDVVCGGPPCQDFSVAGLRAGMDGERGNLSLVYMRALHAIKPRNAIVENVPGWLSDKKNAFGCFLAGLVGADDALPPPAAGKWPNSGMVAGPKGRAAWTILDAQYFGLAQRRKRVIVIADFGNGADPAAVLFERFGLQRNPPARGKAGEGVAAFAASSLGNFSEIKSGGVGGTIRANGGDVGGGTENLITFDRQSNCEYGNADIASTVSARDYKSPTDLVAHCLAGNMLNRTDENGPMGSGISDNVSFTLTKNDVHAVCITGAQCVTGDVTHALKAEGADASEDGTGRGNPIVATSFARQSSFADQGSEEISGTLVKNQTMAVHTVALRGREGGATAEIGGVVATALRASGGGGDKAHVLTNYAAEIAPTLSRESYSPMKSSSGQQADWGVVTHSAVRRLTPKECERLMGFPDNYTNIPWRGKPTSPDGPRYKALGNSWAVPVFEWIGDRITRLMPPISTIKEAA